MLEQVEEKREQATQEGFAFSVWTMDEQRLGLKPVTRRIWAIKGSKPRAIVNHQYEWLYLYGFVQPETGQTYFLILPFVNVVVMNLALAHFALDLGLNSSNRVLLVLDQAGWHVGKDLVVPDGLELMFLPSHSPELQPAERLWPLTSEAVANRSFADLDALEGVLADRCVVLGSEWDRVRALTLFSWWPRVGMIPLESITT
jgi:transposase